MWPSFCGPIGSVLRGFLYKANGTQISWSWLLTWNMRKFDYWNQTKKIQKLNRVSLLHQLYQQSPVTKYLCLPQSCLGNFPVQSNNGQIKRTKPNSSIFSFFVYFVVHVFSRSWLIQGMPDIIFTSTVFLIFQPDTSRLNGVLMSINSVLLPQTIPHWRARFTFGFIWNFAVYWRLA